MKHIYIQNRTVQSCKEKLVVATEWEIGRIIQIVIAVAIIMVASIWTAYKVHAQVELSEIFPNPEGKDTDSEFIELFNNSSEQIILDGWKIDDYIESGSSAYDLSSITLEPYEYKSFPYMETKININNSKEEIHLIHNEMIKESVEYGSSKEGQSYAQVNDIWVWTDPTPGLANKDDEVPDAEDQNQNQENQNQESEVILETDAQGQASQIEFLKIIREKREEKRARESYSQDVHITEIYPNPEGDDRGREWIKITNTGNQVVDMDVWSIDDEGGSRPYALGGSLKSGKSMKVYSDQSKITLNNGGDTVYLIAPSQKVMDMVVFGKAKEGEILTRQNNWEVIQDNEHERTSTELTTQIQKPRSNQKENVQNNEPKQVETKKEEQKSAAPTEVKPTKPNLPPHWQQSKTPKYAGIQVDMGRFIYDPEEQDIEIQWNFGDGEAQNTYSSTQERQSHQHTYSFPGTYTVTASVRDGAHQLVFQKQVEIEQYPNMKNQVIISEIFPQPLQGKKEWIELYNKSNQAIDLSYYMLADNTSTLPYQIPKNTIIQRGSFLVFTREVTHIALSQNETVTLLAPDSREVDSVSYQEAPINQSITNHRAQAIWTTTPTPGRYNLISIREDARPKKLSPDEVKKSKKGEVIEVTDVVTAPPGSAFDRYGFTEGGLSFRMIGNEIPHIKQGDTVTLKAEIEEIDQFVRLKVENANITKHSTQEKVDPIDLDGYAYTQDEIVDNFAFQYVQMSGSFARAIKESIYIDQTKVSTSKYHSKMSYGKGAVYQVRGIVYPAGTGYVLYPTSSSDITEIEGASKLDESSQVIPGGQVFGTGGPAELNGVESSASINTSDTAEPIKTTGDVAVKNASLKLFAMASIAPIALSGMYHLVAKINPVADNVGNNQQHEHIC